MVIDGRVFVSAIVLGMIGVLVGRFLNSDALLLFSVGSLCTGGIFGISGMLKSM